MKRAQIIATIAICMLLASGSPSAGPAAEPVESAEVNEKMLEQMSQDEQNRRLSELARSVTNLERKITRLDDRLERLEYDLKEVKGKTKGF